MSVQQSRFVTGIKRICIPPKGHQHRVGLNATLAKVRHERLTDERVGDWLAVVEGSELLADPLSVSAVNIREWRRSYDRMRKVPEELAGGILPGLLRKESQCGKDPDRGTIGKNSKPCLDQLVSLKRELADALEYEVEAYDALLDDYERGATTESLFPVFDRLGQGLKALLERIGASTKNPGSALKKLNFPVEDQVAFAREVAGQLGYDFQAGRLDVSAHPFTTGIGPGGRTHHVTL